MSGYNGTLPVNWGSDACAQTFPYPDCPLASLGSIYWMNYFTFLSCLSIFHVAYLSCSNPHYCSNILFSQSLLCILSIWPTHFRVFVSPILQICTSIHLHMLLCHPSHTWLHCSHCLIKSLHMLLSDNTLLQHVLLTTVRELVVNILACHLAGLDSGPAQA